MIPKLFEVLVPRYENHYGPFTALSNLPSWESVQYNIKTPMSVLELKGLSCTGLFNFFGSFSNINYHSISYILHCLRQSLAASAEHAQVLQQLAAQRFAGRSQEGLQSRKVPQIRGRARARAAGRERTALTS